jgi:rubrerythrin
MYISLANVPVYNNYGTKKWVTNLPAGSRPVAPSTDYDLFENIPGNTGTHYRQYVWGLSMTDVKEKIAMALRRAMKGEEDGYRFYDIMVKKATNANARRKLEGLRDDEVRHQQTLRQLHDKHVGGDIGALPEKGLSALSEVFKKGRVEELTTEMQFISLAIEAELAATRFYQQERELIDDPEFRDIFDLLAAEEHHHFELLQAEKEALSGNYNWFGYDSGAPLEH